MIKQVKIPASIFLAFLKNRIDISLVKSFKDIETMFGTDDIEINCSGGKDTKFEKELIKHLETKLLGLHNEEMDWRKAYQRKYNRLQREKMGWTQQIGKIIFISDILREFFNKPEVPDQVWKERKWKFSKDGNKIVRDYGKKKKTKT